MATSDLHMQIAAFDYARDRVTKSGSLAKLATLIKAARAEAVRSRAVCMLVDNGDTLQGSPMVEMIAQEDASFQNPMIACLNHLDYDVCGLGNHDFDHGLDYLGRCIDQIKAPVVSTNLSCKSLPKVARSAMVSVDVAHANGKSETLCVGVISSIPSKTVLWNRYHLQSGITVDDPVEALKTEAARLRAQGANLILALAHMGLELFDEGDDTENKIADVAKLSDVDVVIGGHTHLRFPGPDHASLSDIDCDAGLVQGKPTVLPGYAGSDLGLIDLVLEPKADGRWAITEQQVALRSVSRATPEDQDVIALATNAHSETRSLLAKPVGHLERQINSFFALAHPSPVPALMGAAKRKAIEKAVDGSEYATMPLLAVASAPLTGGFAGPENFLDLSAGPIHLRHVAGMNPYSNNVWAVRATGAQIVDWLERSAMIFNTLEKDRADQLLVNPSIPGFRYDAFYGLSYQIDPTQQPLFDPAGRKIEGRQGRVRNVLWQGKDVPSDQQFLIATTDHRAGGGGVYKSFSNADIIVQGQTPIQQSVLNYIQNNNIESSRHQSTWQFAPDLGVEAVLLTAPEAIHSLDEIAHLRPEACGETEEGFLRLRLHL